MKFDQYRVALVTAVAFGAVVLVPSVGHSESAEWKKLVAAAKKEGKVEVILGGQMPRKLRVAVPEFEKKYGIKVSYQTGSSRKHSARVLAERRAGKFTVDVWIGGANTALSVLYPNKVIARFDTLLVDPEVKDPKKWYLGRHHYTDPEGRYIFTWGASPAYVVAYNKNLVKNPGGIKSYWDMLAPKYKGKIVARNFSRGGSAATAVPMLLTPGIGEKWFKKFANEMDVTFVRDSRQGAEWLAQGRFALAFFGINTPALKLAKEGFPVGTYLPQVLKEGEILSASAANIYALKNPPNPNAQKLFVNWALSKEGQSLFIKIGQTSDSLRNDVDSTLVADQYRIKRDRKYFVAFSDKNYINNQRKHLKKLKKIYKGAKRKK